MFDVFSYLKSLSFEVDFIPSSLDYIRLNELFFKSPRFNNKAFEDFKFSFYKSFIFLISFQSRVKYTLASLSEHFCKLSTISLSMSWILANKLNVAMPAGMLLFVEAIVVANEIFAIKKIEYWVLLEWFLLSLVDGLYLQLKLLVYNTLPLL